MQITDTAPRAPESTCSQDTRGLTRATWPRWRAWVLLVASLAPAGALSQSPTVYEEQGQLIRGSGRISTLGPDLFGDKVSLYTGSVEFVQTDVSVPGNNALPVSVGRRLLTGSTRISAASFGDWDLDLPHLKGVFSSVNGWDVWANGFSANRYKRCSLFDEPSDALAQTGYVPVMAQEFWFGNHLYVPGAGEQELLLRQAGATPPPSDGQSYPVLTKSGWALRCLSSLANAQPGEGFVAVSPDGAQYRFDWLVSRSYPSYRVPLGSGSAALASPMKSNGTAVNRTAGGSLTSSPLLARKEVFLLPTLVTDRFGNTVRYTYSTSSPWQLQSIVASDGRSLTLSYLAGTDLVQSISDGARSWTYSYSGTGPGATLATVTLPDGSKWTFSGSNLQTNPAYFNAPSACNDPGTFPASPLTKTMIHPSGAVGSFTLTQVLHGRSYVANSCPTPSGAFTNWYPVYYLTRSLTNKTLSGPGLTPQSWTYSYGPANGSVAPCTGCADTITVSVTDPRGYTTRYSHSNRWQTSEGQLQRVDEGWNGSTAMRTTTHRYRAPTAGPYPDPAGITPTGRGDSHAASRHSPLDQRIVEQQGVSFTWQAIGFDSFARPTMVTQFSSLGMSRTRTSVYEDNLARWVLGQLKSVTDGSTSAVIERHAYDPTTANRTESFQFGLRTAGYAYHGDGTLYARFDEANRPTYFLNYRRGIAQNVSYPDSNSESAVVDDRGLITRHTNPAGSSTDYAYDAMGRLSRITYPAGDAAAYHPTTLAFEPVAYAEYGLAAGHWRQTVSTGNAINIHYFDALWRPRLTRTWDMANEAGTRRVVQQRWDGDGRKTFESYPQRDISTVDTTVTGTGWAHDALGRVFRQYQDSELGLLTTSTDYLAGFVRSVTNPRGHVTSTGFQVFDNPGAETIATINAPEGVTVAIARPSSTPTALSA